MTTPEVGVTHDVVIYFSDTIQAGLLVKPYSYRVDIAPQYIPRLGDTDPRGADKARWRSFIQDDFSGGSGLAVWDGLTGPTRYASSSFIELNMEADRTLPGPANNDVIITAAVSGFTPRSTSGIGSGFVPNFYSEAFRGPFILEMSNSPHMFQKGAAYVYTSHFKVSAGGVYDHPEVGLDDIGASIGEGAWGKWVQVQAHADVNLNSATPYSGVIAIGGEDNFRIFGAVAGSTGIAARHAHYHIALPSYSTKSATAAVYDDKLWRGYQNHITYLEPADDTYSAKWANPITVGHQSYLVHNMKEFNGRLYIGKKDSLYIYDAGTVYKVEDFSEEPHDANFRMMINHRGALYFNIVDKVYRLTSEGTLELLLIPTRKGYITGGCADDKDIIFTVRGGDQVHETWIFDTQTGGSRKWFKDGEGPHPVYGIYAPATAMGHIWFAPLAWTWGPSHASGGVAGPGHSNSVTDFPVSVIKRFVRGRQANTSFEMTSKTHLITAKLTLGHPNMTKLINKIVLKLRQNYSGGKFYVHYYLDPTIDWGIRTDLSELYDWIPDASWTLLGSSTESFIEEFEYNFPDNTTCKDLLLKFTLQMGDYSYTGHSALQSYEIEYALEPSNLKVYDFTTVAVNNMELLNMEKENSGAHIAATLYSCAVSPRTFVVAMPWPTKHTVRGIVSISTPGGAVPALVHDTINYDGGDIPVHVDEM